VSGHACRPSFAQPEIAINLFKPKRSGASAATGAFAAFQDRGQGVELKGIELKGGEQTGYFRSTLVVDEPSGTACMFGGVPP
jgi:hypothetical protein